MALFGFGKKADQKKVSVKRETSVNVPKPVRTYDFISSEHFKGYKRINITTYGVDNCQKNLDMLVKKHDGYLENLPVTIEVFESADIYGDKTYAYVIVDGLRIGACYSGYKNHEKVFSGQISAIYLRNEVRRVAHKEIIEQQNRAEVWTLTKQRKEKQNDENHSKRR